VTRRTPLSLRTQLALAMAFCVLAAVLFGYGGLQLFGMWQIRQAISILSPAARHAYEDTNANRIPDMEELFALQLEVQEIAPKLDAAQNWALVLLSLIAIGVGVGASVILAARLAEPIEEVAATARRMANGDLGAHTALQQRGAREIAQLVDDFNYMATELEGLQRESIESSAAIAHELRTPLTILRGRLQGMHDGLFLAGPKEIRGLINQVEVLGRIVDDLLTVSLASTGALELRRRPIDVATEVEDLLLTIQPDLEAAGLFVELDLRPAQTDADAPRLRQATLALLENARRHAATGGVVRVETGLEGSHVFVRILDRGPGLLPGDFAHVFDRFWRAEGSRSRESGGSGLGLSVVAAIAQAHGGRARAGPRDGGGAIFEVILPAE